RRRGRDRRRDPHLRQVSRRHDRVGREAVDLRLVEEQEKRARAADPVVGPVEVELRAVPSFGLELLEPLVRAVAELVDLAELDRVGRAGLRARGLVAALQPVVAERALPDAAVLLLAEEREGERRVRGRARQVALVEHAERARGDAVAAAVADVLLHDDGVVLGAEERAGRADVEAGGVGAVLADVAGHQPAQRILRVVVRPRRLALLDERHVAPRVRAEIRGVVVALARPDEAVLGDQVPLLARHLAGLAADADRGVGEEAHPGLRFVAVAHRARSRSSATNFGSRGPRGRRPGRMSHVKALTSWMCTFGSSAMCARSLAAPPVVSPREPQWYGSPTWCVMRPFTRTGRTRSVTRTRASIAARAVAIVAQPPCSRPRSRASSGCTSTNIAGWSSERYGEKRDIPPAVWCSVSRYVVATYGYSSEPGGLYGSSGRSLFHWRRGFARCE